MKLETAAQTLSTPRPLAQTGGACTGNPHVIAPHRANAQKTARSVRLTKLSKNSMFPDRDSNPNYMNQNHMCYHYTIREKLVGREGIEPPTKRL